MKLTKQFSLSCPISELIRIFAASLLLLALPACAIQSKAVFHTFEFGSTGENQDIEILNWRYGHSKLLFTRAPDAYLATGHIPQGWNASGIFPVADSLYVKWRVKSTDKIYEDTVDLKNRLPWKMKDTIVHFLIKGPQLYVYLIEGYYRYHASTAPDCPVTKAYSSLKCTELYPEHWSNF